MLAHGTTGHCYRCRRYRSPFVLNLLYLDPVPVPIETQVQVCDDCLADEGNVVRVSTCVYRVTPQRDLTKESKS
jgi:hypothetical protein